MANQPRSRQARQPSTPQNSALMGMILVVATVVIALLLFNAGGGGADDTTVAGSDKTGSSNGTKSTTTTSTTPPPVTTPIATLEMIIGNGSGIGGRAKATAERFIGLGYVLAKGVDANTAATTVIYHVPDAKNDALAVAAIMGFGADRIAAMPATSPLKTAVGSAKVVVVVGPDFDPTTAAWGTVPATN